MGHPSASSAFARRSSAPRSSGGATSSASVGVDITAQVKQMPEATPPEKICFTSISMGYRLYFDERYRKASVESYVATLGLLFKRDKRSIPTMASNEYYQLIKSSISNKKHHGLESATVLHFGKFYAARAAECGGEFKVNPKWGALLYNPGARTLPLVMKPRTSMFGSSTGAGAGGSSGAGAGGGDEEMVELKQRIPIVDPISLCRIETPVRGKNCTHLQAFDREPYIEYNQMMEKTRCRLSRLWNCPFCANPVKEKDLVIVDAFVKVLEAARSLPAITHVDSLPDGTLAIPEDAGGEAWRGGGSSSDEEAEQGNGAAKGPPEQGKGGGPGPEVSPAPAEGKSADDAAVEPGGEPAAGKEAPREAAEAPVAEQVAVRCGGDAPASAEVPPPPPPPADAQKSSDQDPPEAAGEPTGVAPSAAGQEGGRRAEGEASAGAADGMSVDLGSREGGARLAQGEGPQGAAEEPSAGCAGEDQAKTEVSQEGGNGMSVDQEDAAGGGGATAGPPAGEDPEVSAAPTPPEADPATPPEGGAGSSKRRRRVKKDGCLSPSRSPAEGGSISRVFSRDRPSPKYGKQPSLVQRVSPSAKAAGAANAADGGEEKSAGATNLAQQALVPSGQKAFLQALEGLGSLAFSGRRGGLAA